MKAGIVDPTKVARTALQDAASVAGLLVIIAAMVAEKPDKKASAMPPGGGMQYGAAYRWMLGFKGSRHAAATIAGIGLMAAQGITSPAEQEAKANVKH